MIDWLWGENLSTQVKSSKNQSTSTINFNVILNMKWKLIFCCNLQTMLRPYTQTSCCKTIWSQQGKTPSQKSACLSWKNHQWKLLIGFFLPVSEALLNYSTNYSTKVKLKFQCKLCSAKHTQCATSISSLTCPQPLPCRQS